MNKGNKAEAGEPGQAVVGSSKARKRDDKDRNRTPEPKTDRERAEHQDRVRLGREE